MDSISLIFPHQLFEENPATAQNLKVYLVEEELFFNQYRFHKQKLAFHRASMKFYKDYLEKQGLEVEYIEAVEKISDVRKLIPELRERGIKEIHYMDVTDDWLRRRLKQTADEHNMNLEEHDTPLFLNSRLQNKNYFEDKDSYYQTDFYIDQRKKREILIDEDQNPTGGKWSFDPENRSKYPKNRQPPTISFPDENEYHQEAKTYVENHFSDNYGQLSDTIRYPVTFSDSRAWLQTFLEQRFREFGDYQDAIIRDENFLHHSLLTPMLNTGLIAPQQVLDSTLAFAGKNDIPMNSLEGFVRQILGWREFIRAIYELEGRRQRTENFWDFTRKIPSSFWDGTTGIEPLDVVIRRVIETGYCHHIERLMIAGNFMLLCEFDPDEVYRWFMELFVDAYDWVMVPNVYGMSQFADGGLMATKPYISSSNYIRKMSDFEKGDWQDIWDVLFWRFMHVHRDYFEQNPRMKMLLKTFDRMNEKKQKDLLNKGNKFLDDL